MLHLAKIKHFLVWITFFVGIVVYTNLRIDKFQIFRKHERGFYNNERYQNAGLINNYLDSDEEIDTVFIGTSMVENFSPLETCKFIICSRAIKLTASGSSLFTQKTILDKALRTQKVRNVIWLLNSNSFQKNPNVLHKSDKGFEKLLYLYDENPINDLKYLMNIDNFNKSLGIIAGSKPDTRDLNSLYNWGSRKENLNTFQKFSSARNIELQHVKFDKFLKRDFVKESVFEGEFRSFQSVFFETVEKNPKTNFFVAMPPYSIYRLAKEFSSRMAFLKLLLTSASRLGNVFVYAFDHESFVKNVYHYKDLSHYSMAVNSYMIEKMGKASNRLRLEDFENYRRKVASNLMNGNIRSFEDKL
ncbi:hypothetical protein N9D31_02570 [Oligoflexaceae bacterium]|nr:hypothetical protein [Oligoflexaceae bacterium]